MTVIWKYPPVVYWSHDETKILVEIGGKRTWATVQYLDHKTGLCEAVIGETVYRWYH